MRKCVVDSAVRFFAQSRFYGLWSQQRQTASVGVKTFSNLLKTLGEMPKTALKEGHS